MNQARVHPLLILFLSLDRSGSSRLCKQQRLLVVDSLLAFGIRLTSSPSCWSSARCEYGGEKMVACFLVTVVVQLVSGKGGLRNDLYWHSMKSLIKYYDFRISRTWGVPHLVTMLAVLGLTRSFFFFGIRSHARNEAVGMESTRIDVGGKTHRLFNKTPINNAGGTDRPQCCYTWQATMVSGLRYKPSLNKKRGSSCNFVGFRSRVLREKRAKY